MSERGDREAFRPSFGTHVFHMRALVLHSLTSSGPRQQQPALSGAPVQISTAPSAGSVGSQLLETLSGELELTKAQVDMREVPRNALSAHESLSRCP